MSVMRRSMFSTLVLSVAAIVCAASLSMASPGELTASDRDALINIRTSANAEGEIIETRPVGERVDVLSLTKSNEGLIWYKVKVPQTGTTGWVRGDLVKIFGGKKPTHTTTTKPPRKENSTASFPLPKPSVKPKPVANKPPSKAPTHTPAPVANASPKPASSPSPTANPSPKPSGNPSPAANPSSTPSSSPSPIAKAPAAEPTSNPSATPTTQPAPANPAASPSPAPITPTSSPSPTATSTGGGTPESPSQGEIATSTIVAFQTPSYAVRIFSRSGQLRLNLFNRRTNNVALKEVPIQSKTLDEGTTYSYSKDLEVTVFVPNTGATRLTTSALGSTVEEYAEPTATGGGNP